MKRISLITLTALLIPFQAHAGTPDIPEPGILPLLGVGIAAAIAVKFMRKK